MTTLSEVQHINLNVLWNKTASVGKMKIHLNKECPIPATKSVVKKQLTNQGHHGRVANYKTTSSTTFVCIGHWYWRGLEAGQATITNKHESRATFLKSKKAQVLHMYTASLQWLHQKCRKNKNKFKILKSIRT